MDKEPKYYLRWRGRQAGPFTWNQVGQKLENNDIGLAHEILINGNWLPLREAYGKSTGGVALAEEKSAASGGPAENVTRWPIRWRGKDLGAFSYADLEHKLDTQEIGMLHEILWRQHWVQLGDFFIDFNRELARTRSVQKNVKPTQAQAKSNPGKKGAKVTIDRLTKKIKSGIAILDDINLVIEPNEFVALLGPSGSGKSTLMNGMTGRQKPTAGGIFLNGDDLVKEGWRYRGQIGHVPQKDIVHLPLTVQQELNFAAELRLSANHPAHEINARVDAVINEIGLQERRNTRNSNLSGGQIKRVSLGVELLSDPQLLFLDEATSGLDAGTEARMMTLFRRLADEGRTVVCITHNLENVCLCDLAAVLVGGRLAYYGPPSDILGYFGVTKFADIYDSLASKTPAEWAATYSNSSYHEKYVASRMPAPTAERPAAKAQTLDASLVSQAFKQFGILTRRYFTVAVQDRRNILLLLAQAPVIACLIGIVYRSVDFNSAQDGVMNQKILGLLLIISAIWFGCINSAREIVKELPLYLRERAISLNLLSYLGSKLVVLSLFCVFQCASLLSIVVAMSKFRPQVASLLCCLILTSFAAMLMGLLVSSLVKNEDKAIALVPIILIPQVVFSGALLKLTGFAELIAKYSIISFWSQDTLMHTLKLPENTPSMTMVSYGEGLLTIFIFLTVFGIGTVLAMKLKDAVK